eukprot:1041839-Rhodomonas_salina.1
MSARDGRAVEWVAHVALREGHRDVVAGAWLRWQALGGLGKTPRQDMQQARARPMLTMRSSTSLFDRH